MSAVRLPEWTKNGGGGVFVVDVFRQLGYEPLPEATWVVGQAAAKLWVNELGFQPHLVRHKKTNASGNHSMAVYPPEWHGKLAVLVRSVASLPLRQGKLF